MERVVLRGLSALRWAAWGWMAAVVAMSYHDLRRSWLAAVLVAARRSGSPLRRTRRWVTLPWNTSYL
jgi:hypothetical protein